MVIAGSSLFLGVVMLFDGLLETGVTFVIASGFIGCLGMGVMAIRRHRAADHRKWILRMLAFGYTPITMRLVLAVGTSAFALDGQAIFAETM